MAQRVTFYIDGFNFYYGLKNARSIEPQWAKCYWIDMVNLCKSFLSQEQELVKVVYFTASPLNKQKSSRQSAFLNANKLRNGALFEVVRGKYMQKDITCPVCDASFLKPEEKKTDVNISVRMIEDCVTGVTDVVALVSADTDLMPPIDMIRKNFPNIKLKVYFPPARSNHDIKDNMARHRGKVVRMDNNLHRFIESIMPDVVSEGNKSYYIPDKWKRLQGSQPKN